MDDIPLGINRLPPELLAQIFEQYVGLFLANREDMYSDCQKEYFSSIGQRLESCSSPYQWFRIMRVCRYWRDVAISTSSLWSCVFLTNAECAEKVVEHSLARNGMAISIRAKLKRDVIG